MVNTILQAGSEGKKKDSKRAKRMQRSAEHLALAAQLTYGDGDTFDELYEQTLLHYVIAMEALLADEENLDLSRKVAQRASALHMTDETRMKVYAWVRKAYNARSKYVHGDLTDKRDPELPILRQVALSVFLRWLIIQSDLKPSERDKFHQFIDESTMSEQTRDCKILQPLTRFFGSYQRKRQPRDFSQENDK
ncbi:hypothetical protein GCM10009603_08940 [Nocardiopsis exhalans]